MSAVDRIQIFPSRNNLVLMKQRLMQATRGLNLLKRKREALELKHRELFAELDKIKSQQDSVMGDAIFSLSKANFLGTDFKPAQILDVDTADIWMRSKSVKVVGLNLPIFDLVVNPPTSFPLLGLARGGVSVEIVRKKFQEAVQVLVKISSTEYAIKILEDGIQQNNRRINGLEFVVIPRIQNTIIYIRDELDEYEREDFYRLKKSQAQQRKIKDSFAAIVKQKTLETDLEVAAVEEARKSRVSRHTPDHLFDMSAFKQ